MKMMYAAEERHVTFLEMQVGSLLQQRADLLTHVQKLRDYIYQNCPHSESESDDGCPTCQFLKDDAK